MRISLITTLAAAVIATSLSAHASPVSYSFAWTGSNGYTMTGNFSYDSSSAADGAVRSGEVTSLFFEGFQNGISIGATANASSLSGFNFNFDTVAQQFFLGGDSFGPSGQRWNYFGSGLGFVAGSVSSSLSAPDQVGVVFNPVPLVATPNGVGGTVPEPSSLALVGLALFGAAATARRGVGLTVSGRRLRASP